MDTFDFMNVFLKVMVGFLGLLLFMLFTGAIIFEPEMAKKREEAIALCTTKGGVMLPTKHHSSKNGIHYEDYKCFRVEVIQKD